MYPVAEDGRYKFPATGVDPYGDRLKAIVTRTLAPGDWESCFSFNALERFAYIRTDSSGHATIGHAWPAMVCVTVVGETPEQNMACRKSVEAAIARLEFRDRRHCEKQQR